VSTDSNPSTGSARERIDAGVLGIVTVTVDRASDLPGLLSAEASGRFDRFRGYRSWTTPEFSVDSAAADRRRGRR
jgi:hypothetical protein